MSFLQSEIPSPRQALSALRRKAPAGGPRLPRTSNPLRPARVGGRSVVGLDIEPGGIVAVETLPHSVTVRKAAHRELPVDIVRDGEVVDPDALGAILRDFFAENGFGPRVRIGLANQRTVMRTIDLPPITDERQLASAVRFQAQEHIAMPLEQTVLEHQSLGLVGTADGPRSRVVLVAARKEMVERLLSATRTAGLRLEGVDLSAFALIRAMHRSEDGDAQIAYLNVASMTNLAVASGTQCLFTRVIPTGTDSMVTDLAARRGLTSEHARGWLRHVGLSQPVEAIEGQAEIVSAAREVLEDGVGRIAAEIRSTLDFYRTQADGPATEKLVLTGAATSIGGFADRLAAELGTPTEVRTIATDPGLGDVDAGQFAVAAGLTTLEAPR